MHYRKALVIGGSRGVGRALSLKLNDTGVQTVVVARNGGDLDSLRALAPEIETIAGDAADGMAAELMNDVAPDLLLLVGGHRPRMAPLSELDWQEFSAAWHADTRIAFDFTKAALQAPMRRGGAIVSFASGAAIGGSPLSGGYAGAKRMQHLIANYAKWEADRRDLGLTFYTIYPKQLIAGTRIADEASSAYADARSVTQEQFMSQWEKPLTAEQVADSVMDLLTDESGANAGTYTVAGTGREAYA